MGNSQSNPHEYTPEQYKQYLEYQEQQKRVAQFQPNAVPSNMQQPTQASIHEQKSAHIINNIPITQSSQSFKIN